MPTLSLCLLSFIDISPSKALALLITSQSFLLKGPNITYMATWNLSSRCDHVTVWL